MTCAGSPEGYNVGGESTLSGRGGLQQARATDSLINALGFGTASSVAGQLIE